MFARILGLLFAAPTALLLYLVFTTENEAYALYLIPFVLMVVLIYILSPQINWWWYQKHPPTMDKPMQDILQKQLPFYINLNASEKQKFRDRLMLFMMAKAFLPKAIEKIPEDFKVFIAATAVQITFGQEDYLFPKFEHIVLYPHPFPSPQYPEQLHTSELQEEDSVLLFSTQHLITPFLKPENYYNIVLHEWSKAYMLSYPKKIFPELEDNIWEKLHEISGFSKKYIEDYIGIDDIDPQAVSINLFFTFPQQFAKILPKLQQQYLLLFNLKKLF